MDFMQAIIGAFLGVGIPTLIGFAIVKINKENRRFEREKKMENMGEVEKEIWNLFN